MNLLAFLTAFPNSKVNILFPLLLSALCLSQCAQIKLTDPNLPPPADSVPEEGDSQAWSAATPALIKLANNKSFDYRTQLDLARAGNPGAMTKVLEFTDVAQAHSLTSLASHAVGLRELNQIQAKLFTKKLKQLPAEKRQEIKRLLLEENLR